MNTQKRYFIYRISDGLLYSHYDSEERREVWNKSGKRYNCDSRFVYLAQMKPECYKLISA
jgi:hypothetical protein